VRGDPKVGRKLDKRFETKTPPCTEDRGVKWKNPPRRLPINGPYKPNGRPKEELKIKREKGRINKRKPVEVAADDRQKGTQPQRTGKKGAYKKFSNWITAGGNSREIEREKREKRTTKACLKEKKCSSKRRKDRA